MAAMVRKEGVYLLPAAAVRDRRLGDRVQPLDQWRERVIAPLFDSQTDHAIMYAFAKKFGFGAEFVKNYKIVKPDGDRKMEEPEMESVLREINRATWTIGYTGQSPERLKLHMKNMNTFDVKTLRREGRSLRRRLLRPAVAVLRNAGDQASGSPNLYMTSRAMMDGGAASAPTSASSGTA